MHQEFGVAELADGHGLGAVRTMPEFRARIATDDLTEAQRRTLVEQAEALVEGLYVHLPLKRAMHAVDPLQSLRLLRSRLPRLSAARFHAELLRIFVGLRDLHTNYTLPSAYSGIAFLGVLVERAGTDDDPSWLVTKVFDNLVGDPHLVAGAEVTHWNGVPMAIAVERNADREAGSNTAARLARGLENMTIRVVDASLPPDEDWVELTHVVGGETRATRVPWRVGEVAELLAFEAAAGEPRLPTGVTAPLDDLLAVDRRTDIVRQVKRRLFAPDSFTSPVVGDGNGFTDFGDAGDDTGFTAGSPGDRGAGGSDHEVIGEGTDDGADDGSGDTGGGAGSGVVIGDVETTRPSELRARVVQTAHGPIAHLRIHSFLMADGDVEAFLDEVIRLLQVLPHDGLVLDVRGNGGGYVIAAEFLLQLLSPRPVTPEPMQFVSTRATAELCRAVSRYGAWLASIDESVETGSQFSRALPLYPAAALNEVGQLYHGPIVLVTDALCYSATDIFAAGFQDHGIGPVLGVDANTGAGGANVLEHRQLLADWAGGPLRPLPGGAAFRVSLRRCLRVGDRAGQPVEDLGVLPDARHAITPRDLLEQNADLMEAAAALVADAPRRRLRARLVPSPAAIEVTATGLTSVDVYLDGRPVTTAAVADGVTTVPLAAAPPSGGVLRVEGFDGADLVASRRVPLT